MSRLGPLLGRQSLLPIPNHGRRQSVLIRPASRGSLVGVCGAAPRAFASHGHTRILAPSAAVNDNSAGSQETTTAVAAVAPQSTLSGVHASRTQQIQLQAPLATASQWTAQKRGFSSIPGIALGVLLTIAVQAAVRWVTRQQWARQLFDMLEARRLSWQGTSTSATGSSLLNATSASGGGAWPQRLLPGSGSGAPDTSDAGAGQSGTWIWPGRQSAASVDIPGMPAMPFTTEAGTQTLIAGETVEWVNMCLRKAWRVYQRGLERWIIDLLQPVFDGLVRDGSVPRFVQRLRIVELTLDHEAPHFSNMRRRYSRKDSDLTGVVDLRYTGGVRMLLMLEIGEGRWRFKVPVLVSDLDLECQLWLKLRLAPICPWIGTLSFAFVGPPNVKVQLSPYNRVRLMRVPIIQSFLRKLLTVDLPGLMVLPKRLEVNIPPSVTSVAEAAVGRDTIMRAVASAVLQADAVEQALLTALPLGPQTPAGGITLPEFFRGELDVVLREGRNLPVWGFPGQSNPYCRMLLGEQAVQSRRDDDTSSPGSHKHPVWNQEFQFLVEDPNNQTLELQVRDSHLTGRVEVGTASVKLSCLPAEGGKVSVWIPLQSPSGYGGRPGTFDGEILLELTYKPFEEDEQDSGYREAEAFQRTLQQLTNASEERITDIRSAAAASSRAAVAASAAISAIAMTKAAAARAAARAAKAAQQAAVAAAEQAAAVARLSPGAPGQEEKRAKAGGTGDKGDNDGRGGVGSSGRVGSKAGTTDGRPTSSAAASWTRTAAASSNGNGTSSRYVEADVVIPPPPIGPGYDLEVSVEQQLLNSLNERTTPEEMAQALFASQRAAATATTSSAGAPRTSQPQSATATSTPAKQPAAATATQVKRLDTATSILDSKKVASTNGSLPSNLAGRTASPQPLHHTPAALGSMDWMDSGGLSAGPPEAPGDSSPTSLQGSSHVTALYQADAAPSSGSSSNDADNAQAGPGQHPPLPLVLNRVHDLGMSVGSVFGLGKPHKQGSSAHKEAHSQSQSGTAGGSRAHNTHTDAATGAQSSNASWATPFLAALSVLTSSPSGKAHDKGKGKERGRDEETEQGATAGSGEVQAAHKGQRPWWDFWSFKEEQPDPSARVGGTETDAEAAEAGDGMAMATREVVSSRPQGSQSEGRPWWKFWEKDTKGGQDGKGGKEGGGEDVSGESKPVEAIIIPPDLPIEEIAREVARLKEESWRSREDHVETLWAAAVEKNDRSWVMLLCFLLSVAVAMLVVVALRLQAVEVSAEATQQAAEAGDLALGLIMLQWITLIKP